MKTPMSLDRFGLKLDTFEEKLDKTALILDNFKKKLDSPTSGFP